MFARRVCVPTFVFISVFLGVVTCCTCPTCNQKQEVQRCQCCVYRQLGKRSSSGSNYNSNDNRYNDNLGLYNSDNRAPGSRQEKNMDDSPSEMEHDSEDPTTLKIRIKSVTLGEIEFMGGDQPNKSKLVTARKSYTSLEKVWEVMRYTTRGHKARRERSSGGSTRGHGAQPGP
ncbi:hypothetical protein Btru_071893 [Bulinus truncatus]|nr:hypothetical protein Btru_071893 [Bulinus truncatus]